jgi:hypothetical protein
VTARADAHMLRLSLLYALLDQTDAIDVPHVEAAAALWRYCAATAEYIWGRSLGDPVADRLLAELRAAPTGLDRTALAALTGRHRTAAEIDRARDLLVGAGLATVRTERTGGRPREVLAAVHEDDDKHEDDEAGEGLLALTSPVSPPCDDADDVLDLPLTGGQG